MEQNFKIALPKGCTARIKKQNGYLVVTFEPEKWKPEDGDICVSSSGTIFIFNGNGKHKTSLYCALFKAGNITYSGALNGDNTTGYRYATEEEKQLLFYALAKKGKRWNADKKCIEDLPRWRAKKGEEYYSVSSDFDVNFEYENFEDADYNAYTHGNYFKTQEAAEKVAEQIREIFKNSKAE